MSRTQDIEDLLRAAAPRVLAAVVRRFGDFSAAEDATQEAMLAASDQWPRQGRPENPVGWLIHVASVRMVDRVRSDSARRDREVVAAAQEPRVPREAPEHDDTLALMFMSCHPELTPASAIALTLRAIGGLTTAEIASAFLVPEATMAQRISRAKRTIKESGIGFRMPTGVEWTDRRRSVLHILYLIFNEGYLSTGGPELARADLGLEAIRLARIAHRSLPDDPEVTGLLALMLLIEARRAARTTPAGELVPLDEQDRSLWNHDLITEGVELVAMASRQGTLGEYRIQAQIAAHHDTAARPEDTDWRGIVGLYALLERMTQNPMVSLNGAIAVAMLEGPGPGLRLLKQLEQPLAGHYRLHAVRAHLLEMAGELDEAFVDYAAAALGTNSVPERNYLAMKAARLGDRITRREGHPAPQRTSLESDRVLGRVEQHVRDRRVLDDGADGGLDARGVDERRTAERGTRRVCDP